MKFTTFATTAAVVAVGTATALVDLDRGVDVTDVDLLEQYSIDEVQDLLAEWNLDHAFGDYFRRLSVDGDMLVNDLEPQHIDLVECNDATDAHVSKLFRKLDALFEAADEARRLQTAKGISGAGLKIASDEGYIAFGTESDTILQRQEDDGSLNLNVDLSVDGNIDIGSVDKITVTDIEDNTVSYFDATNDLTVFIGTYNEWSFIPFHLFVCILVFKVFCHF